MSRADMTGHRRRTFAASVAALVVLLVGCEPGEDPASEQTPTPTPEATDAPDATADPAPDEGGTEDGDGGDPDRAEVTITETDVATGLEAPWDVAWLDDRAFVTERDSGRLLELIDDGSVDEIRTFPVEPAGEGGLLGLVADPGGQHLFAYFTTPTDNRVVRFDPDAADEPETVLDGIPSASTHDGGRMAFGPDGLLYVATGDAQNPEAAQDETSLAGKILRITPEGDVPDGNPFPGSPVWSLGHRNVQGLAFDGEGRLFAAEFGPDRDDEVNRIEPEANHGWPQVTGESDDDAFTDPILVRQPDEASWSGGVVLRDGAIPQWEGDLFLAALRGERLYRVSLADGEVESDPEELYVDEFGRLRDVTQAPDGSLWLLTNNRDGRGTPTDGDDRIIRLGPDPDGPSTDG